MTSQFSTPSQHLAKHLRAELTYSPSAEALPSVVRDAHAFLGDPSHSQHWKIHVASSLVEYYSTRGLVSNAWDIVAEAKRIAGDAQRYIFDAEYFAAVVHNRLRHLPEAFEILERHLVAIDAERFPGPRSRSVTLLATLCAEVGDLVRAEELFKESFSLKESIGAHGAIAVSAYNYAELCERRDDDIRALEYFYRAATEERELGQSSGLAITLARIAAVQLRLGRSQEASTTIAESLSIATTVASPVAIILAHIVASEISDHVRSLGDAAHHLAVAHTMWQEHTVHMASVALFRALGSRAKRNGEFDVAHERLSKALDIAAQARETYNVAELHTLIGEVYLEQSQLSSALMEFSTAFELFRETRSTERQLACLEVITLITRDLGSTGDAVATMLDLLRTYRFEQKKADRQRFELMLHRMTAERRAREEEIHRLRNIELSSANEQLIQLNHELQELADEKDEFIAMAAHDLRNPLSEMRSSLMVLSSHFDLLTSDDVKQLSNDLLNTVTRMISMVHTFLGVAQRRGNDGLLVTEIADLAQIAKRSVERNATRATRKHITLALEHAEGSVWAQGDATVMDAVLDNLLSNAIKFAPLGSTVHVSVHENPPAISVGDAGPGIPLEEQNELFKKHPRISTRPTGGEESLGVGLYLAQRMARRIHGEISYRRRSDDGGSVFTVRFSPTVSPA